MIGMQGIPLSVYGYALIAMPYGLPVLPLHFHALPLVATHVVIVQPMALCLATADKPTRLFYGVSLGTGHSALPCATYAGYIVHADGAAVRAILSRYVAVGAWPRGLIVDYSIRGKWYIVNYRLLMANQSFPP